MKKKKKDILKEMKEPSWLGSQNETMIWLKLMCLYKYISKIKTEGEVIKDSVAQEKKKKKEIMF